MTTQTEGGRKVGLDKPCTQCGRPVYFNYKGPVPGLCGRCADRSRSRRRKRPLRRRGSGGASAGISRNHLLLAGAAVVVLAAAALLLMLLR